MRRAVLATHSPDKRASLLSSLELTGFQKGAVIGLQHYFLISGVNFRCIFLIDVIADKWV